MNSERPRAAVIGYGGAGRGIHAQLLRAAGFDVVAVVTRSAERSAQAVQDWPGVRVYQNVERLIDDRSRFDLAVVTSPTAAHVEHGGLLADARVPFVVEKPIAGDESSATELVARAAASNTPFTVFHNRRWDPEQLTARAVLASGEIGQVHTFERRWERFRPTPLERWKENDPIGGGLLLDLGSHLVDSAVELFGPVVKVHAVLRALATPTEDDVLLTLTHAPTAAGPGVLSRLSAGSLVGAPGPRTRILGARGAYLVTSFENEPTPFNVLDADAPAGSLGWIVRGSERTPVSQAPGGHADFYRAVRAWLWGQGPIPVDPRDAVRTAQVLDAARVSAREGRQVTMSKR